MLAWTLSGGGNRGPIQVGAMRALFEHGLKPDMLVGTSAGALNCAFLAADPTPERNEQLAQMWLNTRPRDVFPRPRWLMLLRAAFFGNGMDNNKARMRTFAKHLPPGVETFGDLKTPLYLTTADLQTGRLFLYGDDKTAKILPAGLASTAVPVLWDPEIINGHQFVDGGVVANVPISIALDRGATEIYALDLQDPGPYAHQKGVIAIALHSIGVLTYQQALGDIRRAVEKAGVTLHYISLGDIFSRVELQDLSHTQEMLHQGYQRAKEYLRKPTPNELPNRVTSAAEVIPPGAVPYLPRH